MLISPLTASAPAQAPAEIAERKGLGHPDTVCDALAEAASLALSRYYREQFGLILHHNVDKALLWGGRSQPAFRGGEVLAPMEIFLAGRATDQVQDQRVPVEELVTETCRQWLREHLHALDAQRHVKLHTMIRPGSRELVDLYLRQRETGIALANDTSCGVGYAPLDDLERTVLAVERELNSRAIKQRQPEIGEDIKVMGVRAGGRVALTLGCAFVDRHISDVNDYFAKKSAVADLARDCAQQTCALPVEVVVNAADGASAESLYLTVTGTSAEAGDDGEVGRGNRVNGLITPYRPMNMEAAAGKNPVTHVGKLYNIAAQRIADLLVARLPDIEQAECYLVSRIGHPVTQPQVVDIRVRLADARLLPRIEADIRDLVAQQLQQIPRLQDQILAGQICIY